MQKIKDCDPEYFISIMLLNWRLISLEVQSSTPMNGARPWFFFGFLFASIIVGGLMFVSVIAAIGALNYFFGFNLFGG